MQTIGWSDETNPQKNSDWGKPNMSHDSIHSIPDVMHDEASVHTVLGAALYFKMHWVVWKWSLDTWNA